MLYIFFLYFIFVYVLNNNFFFSLAHPFPHIFVVVSKVWISWFLSRTEGEITSCNTHHYYYWWWYDRYESKFNITCACTYTSSFWLLDIGVVSIIAGDGWYLDWCLIIICFLFIYDKDNLYQLNLYSFSPSSSFLSFFSFFLLFLLFLLSPLTFQANARALVADDGLTLFSMLFTNIISLFLSLYCYCLIDH